MSRIISQILLWLTPLVIFSAIINILYLTGSIYMMQVYDRVLSSRSISTLTAISLIALLAFAIQGLLDAVRGRMLARVALRFDELVAPEVFKAMDAKASRRQGADLSNQAPVRDLDQVRAFLSGSAPIAVFDMPFLPIFLAGAFFLHPWLGWLTIFGAAVIALIAIATDRASRMPAARLAESSNQRHRVAETVSRGGGVLSVLGLEPFFRRQFVDRCLANSAHAMAATDIGATYGAGAKLFRQVLQSAALGLGAYLAIQGEMSAGAIIAASIMTSRALAPIEMAVANLKTFAGARIAYRNLKEIVSHGVEVERPLALPRPEKSLTVEQIVVAVPGENRVLLGGVSLALNAGDALGVIGAAGSGKTTLVQTILGLKALASGSIRLDGAEIAQYGAALADHVGYLPQDVELFDGTIADNIGRFENPADDEKIVAAAKAAGAHEMILSLPQGYNTRVGSGGIPLSGGQRQRVGLARALFREPFLLILDEPNSNLDAEGDAALNAAVLAVRQRNGIAILVTHRPSALATVNLVAVLRQGMSRPSGHARKSCRPCSTMWRLLRHGRRRSRPEAGVGKELADEHDFE